MKNQKLIEGLKNITEGQDNLNDWGGPDRDNIRKLLERIRKIRDNLNIVSPEEVQDGIEQIKAIAKELKDEYGFNYVFEMPKRPGGSPEEYEVGNNLDGVQQDVCFCIYENHEEGGMYRVEEASYKCFCDSASEEAVGKGLRSLNKHMAIFKKRGNGWGFASSYLD